MNQSISDYVHSKNPSKNKSAGAILSTNQVCMRTLVALR